MSVFDNVKNMGGPIIRVLRRLLSNETDVVDNTTSLNDALIAAVNSGEISRKQAIQIAEEYVKGDKDGKEFSKRQAAGVKADSKDGFGFDDEEKTGDAGKEKKTKPSPEAEMDEREL